MSLTVHGNLWLQKSLPEIQTGCWFRSCWPAWTNKRSTGATARSDILLGICHVISYPYDVFLVLSQQDVSFLHQDGLEGVRSSVDVIAVVESLKIKPKPVRLLLNGYSYILHANTPDVDVGSFRKLQHMLYGWPKVSLEFSSLRKSKVLSITVTWSFLLYSILCLVISAHCVNIGNTECLTLNLYQAT